jgi:hypothetical protein
MQISSLLEADMAFFDQTPSAVVLQTFAHDLEGCAPMAVQQASTAYMYAVGYGCFVVFICIYTVPMLAVAAAPAMLVLYWKTKQVATLYSASDGLADRTSNGGGTVTAQHQGVSTSVKGGWEAPDSPRGGGGSGGGDKESVQRTLWPDEAPEVLGSSSLGEAPPVIPAEGEVGMAAVAPVATDGEPEGEAGLFGLFVEQVAGLATIRAVGTRIDFFFRTPLEQCGSIVLPPCWCRHKQPTPRCFVKFVCVCFQLPRLLKFCFCFLVCSRVQSSPVQPRPF